MRAATWEARSCTKKNYKKNKYVCKVSDLRRGKGSSPTLEITSWFTLGWGCSRSRGLRGAPWATECALLPPPPRSFSLSRPGVGAPPERLAHGDEDHDGADDDPLAPNISRPSVAKPAALGNALAARRRCGVRGASAKCPPEAGAGALSRTAHLRA